MLINDVVIFTDVLEQFLSLLLCLLPPDDIVIGLLLLQATEEGLILEGYLDELTPAGVAVEALFLGAEDRDGATEAVPLGGGHGVHAAELL
jgi:hypothetical protein